MVARRVPIWRSPRIQVESDGIVCGLALEVPCFFALGDDFGRGEGGGFEADVCGSAALFEPGCYGRGHGWQPSTVEADQAEERAKLTAGYTSIIRRWRSAVMHCPLHRQSRSPLHRPALILSQLNDDEIQTTYTVPQQQVTRLSSDLVVLAPLSLIHI